MESALLLDNFELLAETVGSVAKLRELVLQLAVMGKLVEQDEKDGPAASILQLANSEKRQFDKQSRVKRSSESLFNQATAPPFQTPASWAWCNLDDVSLNIHYGYTASADHARSGIRLLRITDIQDNKVDWPSVPGCAIDDSTAENYLLNDGDIVIARTGGTIGKSFLVSGVSVRAVFASYLIRVIPSRHVLPAFIKRFLESPLYWEQLYAKSMGTGQPNVNGNGLKSLVLPLPPFAEQRRIVAKVDQLLALCDELEARQQAQADLRTRLTRSAWSSVTTAAAPGDFATAWQRITGEFDLLHATPESVADLRQSILQLAVMGKLVEQDGEVQVTPGVPFRIPQHWRWSALRDMADHRLGKMLDKVKNRGKAFPYLRNTNVHWFRIDLSSIKEMPYEDDELNEYRLAPGDILICEGGHGIGRTAVWEGQLKNMMFQKALHRVRPDESLNSRFFAYCMRVYDHCGVLAAAYTGSGIPHLTGRSLADVTFPLPPRDEQDRIVAKVTELLALCDRLEAGLTASQAAGEKLLASVVHRLLNGAA